MSTPGPKHDTVFQSDDGGTPGDWTELVTDDSGNGLDLTNGTGHGYRTAANAAAFTVDEFNVTVRFRQNTADLNYIYSRRIPSSTISHSFRSLGSTINFVINSVSKYTITLPGTVPGSGDGDTFVLSWSGRANPLTTGASDAIHNDIVIWNESDSIVTGGSFTSVQPDVSSADITFGAIDPGGTVYTGDVIDIHYGTRFRTRTEAYNDWIAQPTAPTLTGDSPLEVPVPDAASGFGDEDQLVGPPLALSAASARRNGALTLSPLVNSLPNYTLGTFYAPAPTPARWRSTNVPSAGGATYYWSGAHMWYRAVPLNCNRLKCWVHVQYSPITTGDSTLRIYSMNAHPDSPELAVPGEQTPDEVEYYWAAVNVDGATDDGVGTTGGRWLELDPIRIARTPDGEHTLLAVAFAPHAEGPSWRIRAVHVEPLRVEADNPGDVGGFDFG